MRKSEREDPEDDVLALLQVLATNPEIEAGFSSQWPIKAIVDLLNATDCTRSWTQRSVDNAKEKLGRWIAKKKAGLDDFDDFEALLVRVGRELEDTERARPLLKKGVVKQSSQQVGTSENPNV